MAPPNTNASSSNNESFVAMDKGDVENIGAHCQMEYCHKLDFLPFKCNSCGGKYCLDHRTETAHSCPKAGAWASRNRPADSRSSTPSRVHDEKECTEPSCKSLISLSLTTGVQCTTCNRQYCLKHRFPEEHNCNLTPIGARPQTRGDRGLQALSRLKEWAEKKKAEEAKRHKSSGLGSIFGGGKKNAAASQLTKLNTLKRTAKGEASVPQDKRIYLHVEASADTTKAKYPTGKFFYNKEWSVGRVLDAAAKSLQVENVNNRGGGEEDKLRVFHVEGGRLLRYGDKIGDPCKTGNTIVLLRGVGDPDLIDLTD